MAPLPSPGGVPRRRGSRLVAIAIGVGLLFLFNVNARGINSIDSAVNQYTSLSIASTGTVNLDRYPLLVKNGTSRH